MMIGYNSALGFQMDIPRLIIQRALMLKLSFGFAIGVKCRVAYQCVYICISGFILRRCSSITLYLK